MLLLLGTACSSDDGAGEASNGGAASVERGSTTTEADAPIDVADRAPKDSAEAAVTEMLALLQAGDAAGAYRLLDDAGRRSYATVEEWERRRAGLAPITAFEVERVDGSDVVALVSHDPSLDPFQGLVPARERQTWTAVEAAGGWLVGATPTSEYLLPPDDEAAAAAVAWARDVQACREEAARQRQAVEILFDATTAPPTVCGAPGTVVAGAVENLAAGPASADLVAQYSSDALSWARAVPLNIGDIRFTVIMAPIGDSWEVLGVSD